MASLVKPKPCKIEMRPFHLYDGELSAGGRGLVHVKAGQRMKRGARAIRDFFF